MINPIRAVLFDMGGTLEDLSHDDALRLDATRGIQAILSTYGLDPGLAIPDLYPTILAGLKKYQAWRNISEIELPSEQIWSEYVLANLGLPVERLAAIGEELGVYYDTHFHRRTLRPEARPLLDALRQRGIRLGVISNILSRGAVPISLTRYDLLDYFEVVLTSASFGSRKPNPRIFLEATRRLNLLPNDCAYVGDTVSRDVIGARRAGYRLAIQLKSSMTLSLDGENQVEPPDAVIENLSQVIDLITILPENRK
jgi:putative hydrolase of the HAD superfamily